MVGPSMIPVDSTSLAAIGYDAERHDLYVTFRESGATYVYSPVPELTYRRLLKADSIGALVNREIKPNYDFREI